MRTLISQYESTREVRTPGNLAWYDHKTTQQYTPAQVLPWLQLVCQTQQGCKTSRSPLINAACPWQSTDALQYAMIGSLCCLAASTVSRSTSRSPRPGHFGAIFELYVGEFAVLRPDNNVLRIGRRDLLDNIFSGKLRSIGEVCGVAPLLRTGGSHFHAHI
jgi:hypothetical protein